MPDIEGLLLCAAVTSNHRRCLLSRVTPARSKNSARRPNDHRI